MKPTLKTIVAIMLVALYFSGCVKLYEDVRIERIPRPQIDVDSIVVPPWDNTRALSNTNQ